jgi:sulfate adenylyltransferase subunit 2
MIEFRDRFTREIGAKLIVHINQKAIDDGANPFKLRTQKCCGLLKTRSLLDALAEGGYDAAFGGARRDEEKSRAKERIYSFRDGFGQWDPKNQRPELWNLFNSRVDKGESIRVFPLSNWTELDVWQYIHLENIPIVPMYFAKMREMVVAARPRSRWTRHPPAAGRKTADGDVPDALARAARAPARFVPGSRYRAQDRRRDDAGAAIGTRNCVIDHDQEGPWRSRSARIFLMAAALERPSTDIESFSANEEKDLVRFQPRASTTANPR